MGCHSSNLFAVTHRIYRAFFSFLQHIILGFLLNILTIFYFHYKYVGNELK